MGWRRRGWLALGLLLVSVPALAWDATRLTVPVQVNGHNIPYPEFAVYLLPGQTLEAAFSDASTVGEIRFAGTTRHGAAASFVAPEQPGLMQLEFHHADSGERALIHVFVMVSARRMDADGLLNSYRIGSYPAKPLRGNPIYRPPNGFVEVTEQNADTRVSPNFRLGHFVSKQAQGYPRYVVLRAGLLLKLERILTALNGTGHPTEGLVIMSGYRTPWYNRSIGNVAYSRHVWGGAADIYVDQNPKDGRMDDLNGDRKADRADAQWLAAFVDGMSKRGAFGPRVGGIGVYGSNAAHGPFVHVDVRGTAARW